MAGGSIDLSDGSFDELYERIIVPAVAPMEAERQRRVKLFWRVVAITTPIGLAVAGMLGWFFRDDDSYAAGMLIPFGAASLAYIPLNRFKKRCKNQVLTLLAQALGMTYAHDHDAPGFSTLESLGLMPSYDRARFEDLWTGRRHGCDFQLYEGHLEERRGSGKSRRWVTVFRGQVIKLGFPKKFLGVTVVNRDTNKRWKRDGFQRVGLGASQFERAFEVFGTDQVEARFLVHPAFMERLLALEEASAGSRVRCAFTEGDLLIAVEGSDLFEVVDVFKPVPNKDRTRKGVAELAEVMKVIDVVMAPPPRAYASS